MLTNTVLHLVPAAVLYFLLEAALGGELYATHGPELLLVAHSKLYEIRSLFQFVNLPQVQQERLLRQGHTHNISRIVACSQQVSTVFSA